MITLTHPLLGEREFTDEHARRLLGMENNGGWVLADQEPKKGKSKKTVTNAADSRGNTRDIQGAEKPADDCGCH